MAEEKRWRGACTKVALTHNGRSVLVRGKSALQLLSSLLNVEIKRPRYPPLSSPLHPRVTFSSSVPRLYPRLSHFYFCLFQPRPAIRSSNSNVNCDVSVEMAKIGNDDSQCWFKVQRRYNVGRLFGSITNSCRSCRERERESRWSDTDNICVNGRCD